MNIYNSRVYWIIDVQPGLGGSKIVDYYLPFKHDSHQVTEARLKTKVMEYLHNHPKAKVDVVATVSRLALPEPQPVLIESDFTQWED